MSKKKKPRQYWRNLTQIGRLFGQSAIATGRALAALGYRDRDTKQPTKLALEYGYARYKNRDGYLISLWNKEKVVEQLQILDGWVLEKEAIEVEAIEVIAF